MSSTSSMHRKPVGYPGKRVLDGLGALVLIVLTTPLMALIAVAVRMSSPGPVLFRQRRIGWGGHPFECWKFRTMVHGSSDETHRAFAKQWMTPAMAASAEATHDQATGRTRGQTVSPPYKLNNDPRITRVGRWLRRSSLDELPQLFNVVQGHMSLVGPRPALAYEVEQYQPWHTTRFLQAKPGLTGWWQVHGRGRVSFDDMVRMDLHYLQHCSLATDLRLLWLTVGAVWRGAGAA